MSSKTFFNDYGRPHETGFNNVTGFSTLNEQGPWSLYVRGGISARAECGGLLAGAGAAGLSDG